MGKDLLKIGFGSTVFVKDVLAIVACTSSPIKRLKKDAKMEKRLIDETHGKKTRTILILKTNEIVLSAIHAESIRHHYAAKRSGTGMRQNFRVSVK